MDPRTCDHHARRSAVCSADSLGDASIPWLDPVGGRHMKEMQRCTCLITSCTVWSGLGASGFMPVPDRPGVRPTAPRRAGSRPRPAGPILPGLSGREAAGSGVGRGRQGRGGTCHVARRVDPSGKPVGAGGGFSADKNSCKARTLASCSRREQNATFCVSGSGALLPPPRWPGSSPQRRAGPEMRQGDCSEGWVADNVRGEWTPVAGGGSRGRAAAVGARPIGLVWCSWVGAWNLVGPCAIRGHVDHGGAAGTSGPGGGCGPAGDGSQIGHPSPVPPGPSILPGGGRRGRRGGVPDRFSGLTVRPGGMPGGDGIAGPVAGRAAG
jgi:hypothetical protein